MIAILSITVLAAHLIAVDLAMAAPLACIWLARRQSLRGDILAGALKRRLAWHSLIALAVGIGLGTAQLGVLWLADDRDFFAAARRVPADRMWFTLAELLFYAGCMAGYLWLERGTSRFPLVSSGLAVLAATDLMYHFPPLFSILSLMSSRPELIGRQLTGKLYRALLVDPEVVAMVAHVWLAAVAVTGVSIMRSVAGSARIEAEIPDANKVSALCISTVGARWALGATLLQIPVGVWVLFTVPDRGRNALLGSDPAGTLLFALAIIAAVGLLHELAAAAQGDSAAAQVHRSVALILGVILLMTAALDRTRARIRPESAGLAISAHQVDEKQDWLDWLRAERSVFRQISWMRSACPPFSTGCYAPIDTHPALERLETPGPLDYENRR